MFPLRTDAPLRHTPWLNWALIVTNVVVYLLQVAFPQSFDRLLLSPASPTLWQYLTYQFLHGSFLHLFSNMLFLFIFGNSVCDKMGAWNYLMFYLAGGIIAGIWHVLGSDSPVLGASGAVAAVNGAFLILFPRATVTVLYFFILIGVFEVPSVLFVAFFFLLDVFKQFSPGLFGGQEAVAHLAHIGGTLFGLAVASTLLYARLLPRDQFDAVALIQRWNRRRQFRDVVASGYNPFDYKPQAKSGRPDPREEQIQEIRAGIAEALAHQRPEVAAESYRRLLAIDPQQVLSRQTQLDVANQLLADQQHAAAAAAYEGYLRVYGKHDVNGQVQLMLGLVYARYLRDEPRARQHLSAASARLHDPREIAIAEEELAKLGPATTL
jgi:membrane associated rhomboid family serine protease